MIENFNEQLGLRIRAAREGKLTQATLAATVGLSRTAITNIECGRQRLLVDQLVDIAGALGVPPAELLPAQTSSAQPPHQDLSEETMPTVQQWISNMKRSTARGRR